jgi:hypothetical protein
VASEVPKRRILGGSVWVVYVLGALLPLASAPGSWAGRGAFAALYLVPGALLAVGLIWVPGPNGIVGRIGVGIALLLLFAALLVGALVVAIALKGFPPGWYYCCY